MYFYRGFCKYLNTDLAILLDIGTKPMPQSINRLVTLMDLDQSIGGACGEIEVEMKEFSFLGAA